MPISKNDINFDKEHIWHPYTSMTNPLPMFAVERCEGSRIYLSNGQELIDGMSSWWSTIHGYNHPTLNEAIKSQLDKMAHVMFGGLTHKPAIELAELLIDITPNKLSKIFFSDSGSVSVEVALKMAVQYWHSKQKSEKTKMMSFRHGYHGDTFAAMSISDPENGMHHLFQNILMEQVYVDAPEMGFDKEISNDYKNYLKGIFIRHSHETAAFIIEPVVQGAGGMRFYNPLYINLIRELCDQHEILLIADEIATGLGRTGKLFAVEHANVTPDILCLGKTLTGGYLTLAATLCTTDIAETISKGEAGVFMHGPTFMANPLACSVAAASIKLLIETPWQENIKNIENSLIEHFNDTTKIVGVSAIRVLGAIAVIELDEAVDMASIQPMFVEHGIWVRPFGKLVYIMPAYNISSLDLSTLCISINDVLRKYLHG